MQPGATEEAADGLADLHRTPTRSSSGLQREDATEVANARVQRPYDPGGKGVITSCQAGWTGSVCTTISNNARDASPTPQEWHDVPSYLVLQPGSR